MVQRKVFYKGPWCSQGPFHSSVCQYNCQENFVWWSALHDYSVIRITGVIWRKLRIPKISFLQSVIQESEMFNVLWDRTFEGILPRDRNIEFGCISHEKFPLWHHLGLSIIFSVYCNSLKTLYVVHPDEDKRVYPPKELKKLVIYCPKSSKDIIDRRKVFYTGLDIDAEKCHALKEM